MPKTNRPFEVEAVSDDEFDAGPVIPFTNVPQPPRTAPPPNNAALPQDEELAPTTVEMVEEVPAPVTPATSESATL